jgi:serine protease Do
MPQNRIIINISHRKTRNHAYDRASMTILFLFLFVLHTFSQTLNNVNLHKKGNALELEFSVSDCQNGQQFIPSAEFYMQDGARIPAQSIMLKSGKEQISCGSSDAFHWNTLNDKLTINNNVYAVVSVRNKLHINTGKHLAKSLLFPGWGDYKLRNGKIHIAYGILGYGLLASAVIMQKSAITNYDLYKQSYDIPESDNYFKKSVQLRNISYAMLASAAIVWTVDLGSIFMKSKKLKNNVTPDQSKYYYELANQATQAKSNQIAFDNRSDYEVAMDNGNKFRIDADKKVSSDESEAVKLYKTAQNYFEKALGFKAGDSKAQSEIDLVKKHIANIEERQQKFNTALTRADSLFAVQQLDQSEKQYNLAKQLYPKDSRPTNGLKKIADAREVSRIQQEYDAFIASADILFEQKKWADAKDYYEKAKNKKNDELKPKNRIKECEANLTQEAFDEQMIMGNKLFNEKKYDDALTHYYNALKYLPENKDVDNAIDRCNDEIAKIEQARIDKEYKIAIINADVAYNNKEYDKAKTWYQSATELKPAESYPKNKIKEINNLLEVKEIDAKKTTDLPTLFKSCKKAVFLIESSDHNGTSQGSGFFISSDGTAITNYHVYEGKYWQTAKVFTEDGSYDIETILEKNEEKDYIIFKVRSFSNNFPVAKIASYVPEIGENVFAIGNPEGFSKTLSNGIISGYRPSKSFGENFYIQTNTAITHGSSGGPLFNSKGEVIGITTLGLQEGSLFFAINILKIPTWKYIK